MAIETIALWVGFNLFILGMIAIDLFVFQKEAHTIHYREALLWSAVWISLALLFCFGVYFTLGPEASLNFLTGYLIEYSLSMDNLFVFLVIFSYFSVPKKYIPRVLLWGIIGALIMRAIFIVAGILLIQKFHWITYVFGCLLIGTGIKLALEKDHQIHPEQNWALRLLQKIIPITPTYEEGHFFVRRQNRLWATPLFVVLVVIETTDILFAIDSVPAVLAITQDPFIVYTSNVFAILGLRALYFALANLIANFHFLHYGLATLLGFIGIKMLLADILPISNVIALAVTITILSISIIASIIFPKKTKMDIMDKGQQGQQRHQEDK